MQGITATLTSVRLNNLSCLNRISNRGSCFYLFGSVPHFIFHRFNRSIRFAIASPSSSFSLSVMLAVCLLPRWVIMVLSTGPAPRAVARWLPVIFLESAKGLFCFAQAALLQCNAPSITPAADRSQPQVKQSFVRKMDLRA